MTRLCLAVLAFVRWMLALVALTATAYGQISTSTVTGMVTDAQHAVIPGAQIKIQNEETRVVRTAVSNSDGQFTVTFLVPGTYDVFVQTKGFEQFEQKVVLAAGQISRIDSELKLSGMTQTVAVTELAPLLNAQSSDQLDTVTNIMIRELPQAKLDWTNVLNDIPGVKKFTSANGSTYMLNGLAPNSLKLTVDGTDASNDPEQPTLGFYQQPNVINVLNTDAISEVSVVKGIAPASVSGTMSGNVNLITKSGTNEFHGDVYEINSLNTYNARNQFLTTKPASRFNQYGGALGGPISKDKLFFFASYESVRSVQFVALSATVPTPYLLSISPAPYLSNLTLFPKVPQPANNPTALTAAYSGGAYQVQHDGNTADRVDYYISPTNELTFRYTRSMPTYVNPSVVAGNSTTYDATNNQYNFNFMHTTGRLTSSTRIGYNNLRFLRVAGGIKTELEELSFQGIDNGGGKWYNLRGHAATVIDDVTLSHGRHVFQFGGIVQRLDDGRAQQQETGPIAFTTLSDFMNNTPTSISLTYDLPSVVLHSYQFGGYLQDDYRVSKSVTLNIGIRYDHFTVPKERNGLLFNRGIDPANPQWGPGFGPYSPSDSVYNATYKTFQPRAGFAWSPGSSRQTVIRGGFGVYKAPHPFFAAVVNDLQAGPSVPSRINLNRAQGIAGGLSYPIPRSMLMPILAQMQSLGVLSTKLPVSSVIPRDYPNPYSLQWMFELERQLPFGIVVSGGYVGNQGRSLDAALGENGPDRFTGLPVDPTFPSFAVIAGLNHSSYNALQVKAEKRFSNRLDFGVHYTYSRLRDLCGAADTINGCADQIFAGTVPVKVSSINDPGPSNNDVSQVFNATYIYQLPFAEWAGVHRRAARALIGGWQLSGIFTFMSGSPVNVTSVGSNDRPNIVSGVTAILDQYRSTLHYLNPAAFSAPPIIAVSGKQGSLGNLSRNAFYGPGLWNFDSSLAKWFDVTERVHLQLRGDFFNTFNHTNLSGLVTALNNGRFGLLTSAVARTAQIGARLQF